jgi:hypothetical protein
MPKPIERRVLAARLLEAKSNKGVPQYVVAFQAQIDRTRLSMIKNGLVNPSDQEMHSIAEALSEILEKDITRVSIFPELHS